MSQVIVSGPQHQRAIEDTGILTQTSTAGTVAVTGSTIDARQWLTIVYTIIVATHDVDWSVWGANSADYSDEVQVLAPVKVTAGSNSSYTANPAPFAYYRVKIIDDVGASHGLCTVRGICKG